MKEFQLKIVSLQNYNASVEDLLQQSLSKAYENEQLYASTAEENKRLEAEFTALNEVHKDQMTMFTRELEHRDAKIQELKEKYDWKVSELLNMRIRAESSNEEVEMLQSLISKCEKDKITLSDKIESISLDLLHEKQNHEVVLFKLKDINDELGVCRNDLETVCNILL
jgi:chromosome segregation ATPase